MARTLDLKNLKCKDKGSQPKTIIFKEKIKGLDP